ncbi:MAG: hypothetical protein ACHQX1_02620 [Candidatus Micrarchaeales archaeon]
MNKEKTKYIFLLLAAAFLSALGQFFFKYSFNNSSSLLSSQFLIWFIPGFLAYMGATVFYFMVLSRTHLSWTYGIGGLSYVFAIVFANTILNEVIPPLRWLGVATIFLGVIFIGMS